MLEALSWIVVEELEASHDQIGRRGRVERNFRTDSWSSPNHVEVIVSVPGRFEYTLELTHSALNRKQDLLVRVRYQNPLPPPPFPPRLLHVGTSPARYASYEFLNPLQSERELPMILDGELGLPLEYGKSRDGNAVETGYWLGNREGELCDTIAVSWIC